ncbi:3-keto-disaccharide hydrolase [Spirosoma litoris]
MFVKIFSIGFLVSLSLVSLRAQELNTLTHKEKKEGWKLLFNGKNVSGWHSYGTKVVGSAWQIDQGALQLNVTNRIGKKTSNGGDLVTDAVITGDFEFKAEWKIERFTNSGIFFFVEEDSQYKNIFDTGLEVQVIDDAIYEGADDTKHRHRSGDLFGIATAGTRELQPVGGWNKIHFVLKKNKLTVSLNGACIQEHDITSADWKQRIATSKLKNAPISKGIFAGRIGLQDWGCTVWYRNIKLRQL